MLGVHFGLEFQFAAIVGFCFMGVVSAIETVGDVSGITKGGAGREATGKEVSPADLGIAAGTILGS